MAEKKNTLTADDLYLQRYVWFQHINMASRVVERRRACHERGLVTEGMTRDELLAMWRVDQTDETLVINACRRMAERRGIDISEIAPWR
jgi:hypothetical protein